jgi:type IV pilus assembly protein PilA
MTKPQKNRKGGFTLVELMVVAIIVAILAAVAIPLMSGNKKRAMATEAQSALGTVRTQMRLMYAATSNYATNSNGQAVLGIANIDGVNMADLVGKYWSTNAYSFNTLPDGALAGSNYILQAQGTAGNGCDPALVGVTITLDANGNFITTGL